MKKLFIIAFIAMIFTSCHLGGNVPKYPENTTYVILECMIWDDTYNVITVRNSVNDTWKFRSVNKYPIGTEVAIIINHDPIQ